jgi:UMF1 family MFS transporter
MNKQKIKQNALILAWGLYDLANQFFALNIVSLYFVRWLTLEKNLPDIFYSIAFGISTFLVAVSTPILGVISDLISRRMLFLIPLTLLSVIFTTILGITENIIVALIFFIIANFGCQTAIVFYNALLADIAPKDKIGFVSGFGRMLGYSGALIALYLIKPIVLKSGYQATFFPTGILFLIFALPCMLLIKDKEPKENINLISFLKNRKIFEVFRQIKTNLLNSQKFLGLDDFLKASFFGLCAVNTIILFMSVYASKVFKLNETQVINLIAFSTLFAILGSFISGYLADLINHSLCLIVIFVLWGIVILAGAFFESTGSYWVIGALAGTALGSTWTVSRALAVKIAPQERLGEVFGLFNLVGYLSSIVGSLFWGLILLFLSPLGEVKYRLALLSLGLFLAFTFIFLVRIHKLIKN